MPPSTCTQLPPILSARSWLVAGAIRRSGGDSRVARFSSICWRCAGGLWTFRPSIVPWQSCAYQASNLIGLISRALPGVRQPARRLSPAKTRRPCTWSQSARPRARRGRLLPSRRASNTQSDSLAAGPAQLLHSTQAVSGTSVELSVLLALTRQPVTTPFVTIGSLAVMTPGEPPPLSPALNSC
jgi:hypothetical protein